MKLQDWLALPGNTQQSLAVKVGVTQGAVSQWKNWLDGASENAVRVPAERCRAIEAATDGAVTRHDLRPDIFDPPAGADASAEKAA